ncbi:DUF3813 family protein [Bacillaceae bacterium W0354]
MANNNNGIMQQARQALQNLTNNMTNNNNVNQNDVQAAQELIQQAYNENLTAEEQQELKELENKINNEFK